MPMPKLEVTRAPLSRSLGFRFLSLLLLGACALGAQGQAARISRASAATMPAGSVDMGALPGSQTLSVTVHLAPSAESTAALLQFLSAVATPGSAQYRQWISPAGFGQQFGATQAEVDAVNAFAGVQGLSVAAVPGSGLRLTLSGTVTQMEAAFAPGLHAVQVGANVYFANTAAPTIPAELADSVGAVDGFSNLPASYPVTIAGVGATASVDDLLAALTTAVEANSARVIALSSAACVEDFSSYTAAATQMVLRQAAAQGITVLAASGCGTRGSAGFPSALSEVTAVAIAPGLTPAVDPMLTELRPAWQNAPGLPADNFRHEPDLTVESLGALTQAMNVILAGQPAPKDGAVGVTPRVGNINTALYDLAPTQGLFAQPDNASLGTWEAATGLGLVDLSKLEAVFPKSVLSNNVSITVSNPQIHGQPITFSTSVTDTSGQGNGAVPTGSVTFMTTSGINLGTVVLSGGSGSLTNNQLPGGSYTVYAVYTGDAVYAAGQSVMDGITVQGEKSVLAASATGVTLGQNFTVMVTDASGSGVGTPTGTVTVIPEGTPDTNTYTATLSGSNGTATATVTEPAVQAGTSNLLINCVSADVSFTCYNPVQIPITIGKYTPPVTLTVNPSAPAAGQSTTFTATVGGAGNGAALPSGNVSFSDNGNGLGSAVLNNGTGTFTTSNITGSTHSFTATYYGDNNYNGSSSSPTNTSGTSATTTALTVSPNPPVAGGPTTLNAVVTYPIAGSLQPTGNVLFYEDGTQIATVAVTNGDAYYTTTTISGVASHTFYAVYVGDANFATSTSNTVTSKGTGAGATTTTLAVNPNPPTNGTTTLTATIAYTAGGGTSPTGNVTFYEDGASVGTGAVNNGAASLQVTGIVVTKSHTFYAVYAGDANYSTSTSGTVTTNAQSASTTTTISSTSSTVAQGTSVTFTAQLTPSAIVNNTNPTGTVTFTSNVQGVLCTVGISNNSATCTATMSTMGSQSVTATYNGDGNYTASTSTTPVLITVGQATAISLAVNPNYAVYGTTVMIVATLNTTTTGGITGPNGSVTFTLSGGPNGNIVYTVLNNPVTQNSATATLYLATPPPANYNITATCTGSNYSCNNVSATSTLTVAKAGTTNTLTFSPSPAVVGQPVTFTATVASTSTLTGTPMGTIQLPSGTVTFYYSSTSTSVPVVNGVATLTTTLASVAGNTVTAVYSGDNNYNSSNSATIPLTGAPVSTGVTLTSSTTSGLAGSDIILTATVNAGSTGGNPTGTVTFYDSYNGQQTAIGTATLAAAGANTSAAQLSTTGLMKGTNTITAVYSATGNYTSSTSNAVVINLTDYGVTFAPASLVLQAGQSGTLTATVTAYDGFAGQVVLGCTPPAGAAMTCSFTPTIVTGSGTSVLTVTTTAPQLSIAPEQAGLERAVTGVSVAALLLGFLLPGKRRRRPMLFVVLASMVMFGALGCTHLSNAGTNASGLSGTPQGTQVLQITTSGTDGKTSTVHTLTVQVTVN